MLLRFPLWKTCTSRQGQRPIIYVHVSFRQTLYYISEINNINSALDTKKNISFCGERKHINIGWWPNNTTALSGEEKHLKWHFFYNTLTCGLIVSVTWSKSKLLIIRPMGIEGDA